MSNPDTEKRRIDRFDEYAKYKSLNDNRINKDCGLSLGTLGKSRKPGKDLSPNATRRILETYNDLSRDWLITGRGHMLITDTTPDFVSYPLIDNINAQCGKASGLSEAAKSEELPRIAIPGVPRETEFFIQAAGYSMINSERPELSIPPSALVGLSKVNVGVIRWGEVYAIATDDGIMLKRIFPGDNEGKNIRCVSYNNTEFPEFLLPLDEVKEVARITCVVPVMVR